MGNMGNETQRPKTSLGEQCDQITQLIDSVLSECGVAEPSPITVDTTEGNLVIPALRQFDKPDDEMARKIKKHSAFTSDDLEHDVEAFTKVGYELAIPIRNGNVVKRYAYVKDPAGNYIELVEPREA